MPNHNKTDPLGPFERIDAVLFDPEINMRPKLAALVALRCENSDNRTSSASNLTYAAAVGSRDPRAGSRARNAAIKEGLISATDRPGRAPIVQVNVQRIYSIHDRLNAECANKFDSASNRPPQTPPISSGAGDRPQYDTHANSHDIAPVISDDQRGK